MLLFNNASCNAASIYYQPPCRLYGAVSYKLAVVKTFLLCIKTMSISRNVNVSTFTFYHYLTRLLNDAPVNAMAVS